MYRILMSMIFCLSLMLISCSDSISSNNENLLSLKVVDFEGNPVPSLRVGSINHYDAQASAIMPLFKPCPLTQIDFLLP